MGMKALAVAAVLAVGVAGCGGDDGEESSGSAEAEPSKIELTLTGTDKKAEMTGPDSVAGGLVEITFTSELEGEHAAQLIRVDGDRTAEEIEKAGDAWGDKGQPLADWMHLEGGVTSVPNGTATAMQILEPGRYVAVDISSDIKPSPSVEFEVTEGEGGELPQTDGSVEMKEYEFSASGLTAGKQQVLIENTGVQPHFIAGFPLAEGATIEDAKKALASEEEPEGPPPVDFENAFSTSVMDGDGKQQVVDLDLKAGKYAFVCFVPDRAGGPPHVAKGMVSEVAVG